MLHRQMGLDVRTIKIRMDSVDKFVRELYFQKIKACIFLALYVITDY